MFNFIVIFILDSSTHAYAKHFHVFIIQQKIKHIFMITKILICECTHENKMILSVFIYNHFIWTQVWSLKQILLYIISQLLISQFVPSNTTSPCESGHNFFLRSKLCCSVGTIPTLCNVWKYKINSQCTEIPVQTILKLLS